MIAVRQSVGFSGPLPPPEILERYEKILPGAAERIISMAEKQSEHRKQLESIVIGTDTANSRMGLWFGLIIGLAGLAVSALVAIWGKEWAGTIIGSATLVSLVGTFIYGSQQRKQERGGRREEIEKIESGKKG